ncbi:hypothetical protein [uncultured Treponema sp.]|uniref:hypothetical protein n=1 Tax=uncultured Treponema sp. TaxID=162155 RepID=UPI0025E507DE|nr:hypothetical protein [uncultured Treponema sp.]
MKKFIFPALFAFLFVLASCMNMSGSSGESGSVRVVLPGSARYSFSQDKADKFVVTISSGSKLVDTKTEFSGGVIEFDELNPGDYTIEAKAFDSDNDLVVGWGTADATVNAGESTECTLALALTKCISTFDSVPSSSKYKYLAVASSADMLKLGEWIKSGIDMEGITITLVDDLDMTGCADFDCMGVTKADSTGDIQGNAFKGVFDGAGHSMTLAITPTDPQPMGLFWQNDGTIMNLTIMQYSSTGQVGSTQALNLSRGGVICSVNNGTIKNCVVKASVTSWSVAEIAGIARENSSSGKIVNCLVTGDITMNCDAAASNWAGDYGKSSGIAAVNSGSIENCVYTGKITTKEVTDSLTFLSSISGTISAYTEGSIANCYWLKDCIDRGGTAVNQVAYINKESGGYGKICIAYPEKITGCGYFETNSPTSSVVAGTASECKSEQTLAYSGTLLDMLNAYVSASSDSGLKKWKAGADGNLALSF